MSDWRPGASDDLARNDFQFFDEERVTLADYLPAELQEAEPAKAPRDWLAVAVQLAILVVLACLTWITVLILDEMRDDGPVIRIEEPTGYVEPPTVRA